MDIFPDQILQTRIPHAMPAGLGQVKQLRDRPREWFHHISSQYVYLIMPARHNCEPVSKDFPIL
jgi:hypothetical protein